MNRILGLTRPFWRRNSDLAAGGHLGDSRDLGGASRDPGGNPLMKGLIVLTMSAVVTTFLVVTDDDDPYAVETTDAAEESGDPAGPQLAGDGTTITSVEGASSETARSDQAQAAELALATEAALSGAEHGAANNSSLFSSADAFHRARFGKREADSTTTEAPTTTAAPVTAAPTTEAATTSASVDADTSTTGGTDTTGEDGSASSAAPETTAGDSSTTEAPTSTEAPTTTAAGEAGWVDAGHGVLIPPVLIAIRYCESRDNYQAANPNSSARGAYQFLTGSWDAYGHKDRYGVSQAHLASNAQQDEAALITWQRDGTRPWNASKSCWSARL